MIRVVFVVFDGVQTLDLTGPAEVHAAANRALGRAHYELVYVTASGGEVTTSCGIPIRTRALATVRPRPSDTVFVAGGEEEALVSALGDRRIVPWLVRAARVARRVASVCSGAFLLAAAGLLDGKRATTHWSACDRLAATFPAIRVDRNAIFVDEGRIWTSAGVTTGIDMSLALIELDLGRRLADDIAARLVLYTRRPGYQSQWSDALVTRAGMDPLGPTIAWARAHLGEADLEDLARHAGLSLRTLHRRCLAQLATTPAKLLAKLRVERARELLTTTDLPLKVLAVRCGFGSPARLTRAFEGELGIAPRAYRLLHDH